MGEARLRHGGARELRGSAADEQAEKTTEVGLTTEKLLDEGKATCYLACDQDWTCVANWDGGVPTEAMHNMQGEEKLRCLS